MQKSRTRYQDKLIAELTSLRKGSGITPAKMHHTTALRGLAAQAVGVDDNKITNSQVHNFLLGEIIKLPHTTPFLALRHAFGLGESLDAGETLRLRRHRLASTLNKHLDTIIRYENRAIAELATHLEEVNKNTHVVIHSHVNAFFDTSKQLAAQRAIMRDTVRLTLAGILPVANRGAELLGYLEQSQRPYLEASVDIKFTPSSRGPDWYRLKIKYVFMGMRSTFRLAIVTNSEDGEQLLIQGLVDDFQKLNDTIDPRQEIRTVRNNSSFIAHNSTSKRQKLFRFHELDPAQAQALLQSTAKPLKAPLRILEVKLPTKWQGDDTTYEYHSSFNLRDDIHYAYWYAPSMMFVKKLSFDYSEFPRIEELTFVTIPFLGNVISNSTHKKHSFVVRPNSWIMPGNGIVAVWETRPRF